MKTNTTPTYNVTLNTGRQIDIRDATDKSISRMLFKSMNDVKAAILRLLVAQNEAKRRGLQLPEHMENQDLLTSVRNYTFASINNYNMMMNGGEEE